MAYTKLYDRINWENVPSTETPINEINLNKIDIAVDGLDDRVIELESVKANQSDLLLSIKDVSLNETTGVLTFTFQNNTTKTIDTILEKVITNWAYNKATQQLEFTAKDGTVSKIDISEFITNNEFANSTHIAFTVTNGVVKADLIKGTITGEYLEPNYLADVTAQATAAEASATSAATSAANAKTSEDNAKTSETNAKTSEDNAKASEDNAKASETASKTSETNAATSASTASTKATEATTAATTATTKAGEASTSATNAKTSEDNAKTAADLAGQKAVAADNSAQDAQTSATSAATSAAEAAETVDNLTAGMQDEIDYAVNTGAKSLLPNLGADTMESNGVTFTKNADGSVTANGTVTDKQATYLLLTTGINRQSVPDGMKKGIDIVESLVGKKVTLSGGQSTNIRFQFWSESTNVIADMGDGKTFEIGNAVLTENFNFAIIVMPGVTVKNLAIYPMLRDASIVDDTFQKYAMTNTALTEKVDAVEEEVAAIPYLVNSGAKNLLNVNVTSREARGVTFTVNSDNSVTVNGTATGDADFPVGIVSLPVGSYKISGGADGASSKTHKISAWTYADGAKQTYLADNIGYKGDTFKVGAETGEIVFIITVYSGTEMDNLTFYPMLRDASITDDTYVPYVMTNRELTENKANGIHSAVVISNHLVFADDMSGKVTNVHAGYNLIDNKPVSIKFEFRMTEGVVRGNSFAPIFTVPGINLIGWAYGMLSESGTGTIYALDYAAGTVTIGANTIRLMSYSSITLAKDKVYRGFINLNTNDKYSA